MSTLDDLNAGPGGLVGLVGSIAQRLRPVSRRSLLVGAAVAGSALATKPREYALRPVAAYATICGPGNTASSGWTVFCCTVNKGVNACPPGSFAAGWWKAADSSWCGGGYRYIVDCNASCSKCTTGCSDNMCDAKCWSCSCGTGSSATCDQRRVCCNAFRYGQCNTQLKCSGGVHCRVVSCVAPYRWESCTTTSLQDNRTNEHGAPCLQPWSAILAKYDAMGAQRSYLKASISTERSVGDNRGRYVTYQGGAIYSTATTGARAMPNVIRTPWLAAGGPTGKLGYPKSEWATTGLPDSGWLQIFEKGAVTDSASTTPQIVYGPPWPIWAADGRETGHLGYPTAERVSTTSDGWIQLFQKGAIADTLSTTPQIVYGDSFALWKDAGRETGVLGYPTSALTAATGGWVQLFQHGATCDSTSTTPQVVHGDSYRVWVSGGRETGILGYPTQPQEALSDGWIQLFQKGASCASTSTTVQAVWDTAWTVWQATGRETGTLGYPRSGRYATARSGFVQQFQRGGIARSASTPTVSVSGVMYDAWVGAGREGSVLGYPTAEVVEESRGRSQAFEGGELWALGSGAAYRVYGAVLSQWKAAGGAEGSYGYPVGDTQPVSGGRLSCTFEHGTITA